MIEQFDKLCSVYEERIAKLEKEIEIRDKTIYDLNNKLEKITQQLEDAEFIINSDKARNENKVMSVDTNGELIYYNTTFGNYFAYEYTAEKLRNKDVNDLVEKCIEYMDCFDKVMEYLRTSKGVVLDDVIKYFEKATGMRKIQFYERLNHPLTNYQEQFHNPFIETFIKKVESNGLLNTLNNKEYREFITKQEEVATTLLASTCDTIPAGTICAIHDANNIAEWKVVAQEGDIVVLKNIKLSAVIERVPVGEVFPKSFSYKVE